MSPKSEKRGLRYWMERAVVEAEQVRDGFAADPVHDLRVALRRCRSLADGYRSLDPDPAWRKMRRAGKALFASLGELRDVQILQQWSERLAPPDDAARARLTAYCAAREQELKTHAAAALAEFDVRQWLAWANTLGAKAARLSAHRDIFLLLALEKWGAARALHTRAVRSRSQAALHALRIGLKRFRYVVENFLPEQHARWGPDLKQLQDQLGEIHDLDVLWETALRIAAFQAPEEQERWRTTIAREREQRVAAYRAKLGGRAALWRTWRAELPAGATLRDAVHHKLRLWAAARDADVAHTRRRLAFARRIYAAVDTPAMRARLFHPDADLRELLTVAALTSEAGHADAHKRGRKRLDQMPPPAGWSPELWRVAALAARYHRGALPSLRDQAYAQLARPQRALVWFLAGILRLADRLARRHHGAGGEVHLQHRDGVVVIRVAGYRPGTRDAERLAGARHLLEHALRMPILIAAARRTARRARTG